MEMTEQGKAMAEVTFTITESTPFGNTYLKYCAGEKGPVTARVTLPAPTPAPRPLAAAPARDARSEAEAGKGHGGLVLAQPLPPARTQVLQGAPPDSLPRPRVLGGHYLWLGGRGVEAEPFVRPVQRERQNREREEGERPVLHGQDSVAHRPPCPRPAGERQRGRPACSRSRAGCREGCQGKREAAEAGGQSMAGGHLPAHHLSTKFSTRVARSW